MPFAITVLATAAPTLLYMRLIHAMDRYEREPAIYVLLTFLWGALPAVIAGGLIELVSDAMVMSLFGSGPLGELLTTGISAPIIEETIKAMAVAIVYFARRKEFDGWVDGVIYGSSVGFGFAFVENILYLQSASTESSWVSLFILRVLLFGVLHAFWTSLTGVGFGVARHRREWAGRAVAPLLGLCAAILGHMFHNSTLVLAGSGAGAPILFTMLNYGLAVAGLIAMSAISALKEREMLRLMLADEVPDVLSPHNYATLCGPWAGMQLRLEVPAGQRREFLQHAAELAQRKQQASLDDGVDHSVAGAGIEIEIEIAEHRRKLQAIQALPASGGLDGVDGLAPLPPAT